MLMYLACLFIVVGLADYAMRIYKKHFPQSEAEAMNGRAVVQRCPEELLTLLMEAAVLLVHAQSESANPIDQRAWSIKRDNLCKTIISGALNGLELTCGAVSMRARFALILFHILGLLRCPRFERRCRS
jgi:hypothetical protein